MNLTGASGKIVSQRRYLAWLLPTYTAMCATYQGIQQILIPAQVAAINPAAKIDNLALITTIAAATSVLGLLVGGAMSDRASGRWGKRAPWMASSALVSAALILMMSAVASLALLAVLFAALWFVSNFYQGALNATLIDRVPADRRGVGASVMALGLPLGVFAGVNFAAHVSPFWGYAGLALIFLATTAGFLWFVPEAPAPRPEPRPHTSLIGGAAQFLGSFKSRDFTFAFIARALMFYAIFSVLGFTYYILQDHIGAANLPGGNVAGAVAILLSINMGVCVLSTAAAGWLIHRWNRPRLFTSLGSFGIAAAMLIPVLAPTWGGMLALQFCLGLFFGAYLAVDLALMSLVADQSAGGRDMAILSVATAAPQIMSPAIIAALIYGFGYTSIFVFGALMATGAGLAVLGIKSIR